MSKPQIRVLIVEDDLVDRMACRRALAQEQDYEFVLSEAETGRAGLQIAHAQQPDCVLLDYQLPDLNGLEFLTELRSDLDDIPFPVMMLTGSDNASVAVEAMKRGAHDYLVKDANRQYLELLSAVIQRVLRERRTFLEKKQMEEDLTMAEAKYRFLVEQIPAITYTTALDVPGKLLYVSPQVHQLGFSSEEWLADPQGLFKQIHPEDRTFVHSEIARCHQSGESLRYEFRLLTRAGKVRWFLNEASMVRHESGEPLFLQGILVDITEGKKTENELQEHRRRLEELVAYRTKQYEKRISVLESANANLSSKLAACIQSGSELKKRADQLDDFYHSVPCCYLALDRDGVCVQINDTGLQWLGRARDEVVGRTKLADLLTPASSAIFQENFRQLKERGWLRNLELEITREDGTHLPVLLNANANRDAAGNFVMTAR